MPGSSRHLARPVAIAMSLVVAAAAFLAIPASADRDYKAGTYSGKTSQKDESGKYLRLQLKVKPNKREVTVVFFELSAPPCGGGEMGTLQYAGLKADIMPNGSFNAQQDPYGSVRGNFDGNKAEGTARYKVNQRGVNCDSGRVTWRARKRG
jgi:hypothetical protein